LIKYAFQSLFEPSAVPYVSSDPQTNQIITGIDELRSKSEKIKILDFGAGEG